MSPKRRTGGRDLTKAQQKIIDLIQKEVIDRYFDVEGNEFEILSTLRYDPNFTHIFSETATGNCEIKLDEIDYRLLDESCSEPLEQNDNRRADEANTEFDEFFENLTRESLDVSDNDSLMSFIDSHYNTQESSPPVAPAAVVPDSCPTLYPIFCERFLLLGEHYKRLNFALQFFKWGFHVPLKLILDKLIEALPEHRDETNIEERMRLLLLEKTCYKMRVLISRTGKMRIEAHPLIPSTNSTLTLSTSQYFINTILDGFVPHSLPTWDVFIDTKPLIVSPFTTFKTTYRDHYNESRSRLNEMAASYGLSGKSEILLYNDAYQLMEGSITNVAVIKRKENAEDQMRFVTPSLASGCLCGTMRYYLLKKNLIYENPIDIRDVKQGDTVILFNGVMGAVKGIIRQGFI